jgi:3-oxoacyl-[acyl-carrier protein] reductase
MSGKIKAGSVLLTGAGSGIGRESAILLAERGWAVTVVDLRAEAAAETSNAISSAGGEAISIVADVRDRTALNRAVERSEAVFGPLTGLVANAGLAGSPTPVDQVEDEEFARIFDVNVHGTWNTVRAAIPSLRRAGGGAIVLTGSIMGVRTRPGQAAYASSKAAVNHLGRSFALDLAQDGIRVNTVAPVATDTAMLPTFLGPDNPEQTKAAFLASIPMGRLATPFDVAQAIAFLLSEESSYLTGVTLPVDGGRSI